MGFSMRMAPGVRVRISSRGVRTSLGPRVARVHIGAGRTGLSSGIGPFGAYTSVGGSISRAGRRYSQGPTKTALMQAERQARITEKKVEHDLLQNSLVDIYTLHRTDFELAEHPQAHFTEPDAIEIKRKHTDVAKASVNVFAFTKRKKAIEQALHNADAEIEDLRTKRKEKQKKRQQQLDVWWDAIMTGDEGTILEELNRAFSDNYAIAAAIGVANREASVVVAIPDKSVIPERMPTQTSTGRPSSKKMSNNNKVFFYLSLVTGSMLATVREALAVIPSLESVRVIAIRASDPDIYGNRLPEAVAASRFERNSFDRVQWGNVNAIDVFNQCGDNRMLKQKPRTNELIPIDLDEEDDIREILERIDMSELLSRK